MSYTMFIRGPRGLRVEHVDVIAPGKVKRTVLRRGDPRRSRTSGDSVAKNWPLLSESRGVQPCQIPEALALDRKLGLKNSYHPDGRLLLENKQQHREWNKAHHYSDRS